MLEEYILTGDGKEYIDTNCVREALGIVDEYVDILGVIKKLKEERDQLKEKCDRLKKRANAVYGVSCGYSGDKTPAFLCNVISYDWEFSPINDTLRVELELTPTANYKGTFDLEDLKKYIQNYGREKRVRDSRCDFLPCESQGISADFLRKEFKQFCEQHKVAPLAGGGSVRDWIQYIFKVLTDYRDLATSNFNKAEGFRKEKRAVENVLAELRAKIREIYRSVVDDEWDEYLAYTSALNDINEEYKRVVHNFEERTADWSKAQQELDRYRLAVESLLDIPKELKGDISAIERAFTFSKKQYKSLQEFRDNVCKILDIPSSMADDQEQILKEIRDFADRYYELRDFRADICEVLGIDADELFGSPQQNDQYILAQAEKLKDNMPTVFRNDVAVAIGMTPKDSNPDIIKRVMEIRESHERLARLRSSICTALCLGHEDCDGNIIGRIHMMQDCHEKLCKDYTELRKAIWDAMGKKTETQPGDNESLIGEVQTLVYGNKWLREFRDSVAKAMGMDYPTTNTFIVKRAADIYKDWGEWYDLIPKLRGEVQDLQNKYDDAESRFRFQSGLRQQWHERYESEHERANGEHKRAEKLRSDVTALKNHIELLKFTNASQANSIVASQAFKNECRKLKEEKTKVISALGQDIWDDCVK